jgi:lipopolysaccharide transport system permease protein
MQSQAAPSRSPSYVRDASNPRHAERARDDLVTGLQRWRLAVALARLDIRNRYRGSVLGPFWLTLSTAIMMVCIGFLYSSLLKLPVREYLPFLAVSLLVWNTINQIVADACGNLIASEGIIRQVALPYTVHVLRCVIRNAIIAAHNLPLILVVFAVFGILPGPEALLALAGLGLIAVNTFAAALLLGMVCARFRDIQPIVASIMQLAFFLSPVLWKPELLQGRTAWLLGNPFYVLLETVRGPLLGEGPSGVIWVTAVLFTITACLVAWAFFVRFRGRIAFWL